MITPASSAEKQHLRTVCLEDLSWIRSLLSGLPAAFFKRRAVWGLTLLALAGFIGCLLPFDDLLLEALRQPGQTPQEIAGFISLWGDFYRMNLILLAVGWLSGVLLRKPALRRFALTVFLAALVAGLAANLLRPVIGRPRPSSGLPDGLYGPHLSHNYHGFPSGHAMTAFATSGCIAVLCPPAAFPAHLIASSIMWSRLQLNRHHPVDSLAGATLGLLVGSTVGVAGRRSKKEHP